MTEFNTFCGMHISKRSNPSGRSSACTTTIRTDGRTDVERDWTAI